MASNKLLAAIAQDIANELNKPDPDLEHIKRQLKQLNYRLGK